MKIDKILNNNLYILKDNYIDYDYQYNKTTTAKIVNSDYYCILLTKKIYEKIK